MARETGSKDFKVHAQRTRLIDPPQVHIHNILWCCLLTGYSGGAYIREQRKLGSTGPGRGPSTQTRSQYRPLTRVAEGEAMGKNQHVVPTNDGWGVKGEGNGRLTKTFDTQAEAV